MQISQMSNFGHEIVVATPPVSIQFVMTYGVCIFYEDTAQIASSKTKRKMDQDFSKALIVGPLRVEYSTKGMSLFFMGRLIDIATLSYQIESPQMEMY